MNQISENVPCIKFMPVEENYTGAHIIFTSRGDENNLPGGCYSYVGCQGAQGGKSGQIINLGRGCVNKGLLLHEILHALGATHEQNRKDRDRYVKIVEENIRDGEHRNFRKEESNFNARGTPYDYQSIMHYTDTAFGRTSETKTIIPLMPNITLTPCSSKKALSPIDIIELAKAYENKTSDECYTMISLRNYIDEVEKLLELSMQRKSKSGCHSLKQNIKLVGDSIKSLKFIKTAHNCYKECLKETECTEWSWSVVRERCFLMRGVENEEMIAYHYLSGSREGGYCKENSVK